MGVLNLRGWANWYLRHHCYTSESDSCLYVSAYAIPYRLCSYRLKVHWYHHPHRRLKLQLPVAVERIEHGRQKDQPREWAPLDGELE
jgi:hypothetical protein